jgi:[glutamine synthetase] adenylyltransferase / [glutamine synthetase]-adenylyl-L-tyrosine phosphorylase
VTQISRSDIFPQLVSQGNKSWLQFSEQHSELCRHLNKQQLSDFKQILALSDFVFASAMQMPEQIVELFSSNKVYHNDLPNYSELLQQALQNCTTELALHKILRQFRAQHMVKIATADLLLNMPLAQSLLRLSSLADALIMAALNWLTNFCQQQWGQPQNKHGQTMPLLVYGMGKLGGNELNFSSDIDLIFVYPQAGQTSGARRSIDNQQFFIRLAQKLIAALHTVTADGFVYRVDMRLRPFGESGPLVLTFNAIEDYYQEQGRDWERYAMLKARLIGNSNYHGQLSGLLRPFVYRRYIDFSVIDSLRRMKMMIAQEVRRKQLKNNIKLGAGGIREIEFIVQVFQLIRGGRVKALQQRSLLTVLPLLVEHQVINQQSCEVLTTAYCFLRRVENIIQAIGDKQTQTLPDNELDQQRLLQVLGINSWPLFLTQLEHHMQAVHHEFNALIGEDSPNHQAKDQQWQLCWLSIIQQQALAENVANDEILTWLQQLAPTWQSENIYRELADFNHEVNKRGIGRRGRQILDKLIPLLMWHLLADKNSEATLNRVLLVLTKIASRTAYLELLYENEGALKQLNRLCQASLWLTEHIAKYPILLDELIDPLLLNNTPELSAYAQELRQMMLRIPEDDLETQMETLRQFKQAQHLRIAAGDIVGVLALTKVSDHLTALAESIINEVIMLAWQQVSQRFGVPKSLAGQDHKGFAVIGYGKLGGYELSYSSDLDLVFVHDSQENDVTDGEKPVSASHFYGKLAQRIMHIFNSRMASGILYELDMRLRPSGNSGVLVVHIDTFAKYQQHDAWTWEHQALVRARAVYGHKAIVAGFNNIRQQVLSLKRQPLQLKQDVINMRDKMRSHLAQSSEEFFDIKQAHGGLVDIEFLVQYLVLANSYEHHAITDYSDNLHLLKQLNAANILTGKQQQLLSECYIQLRDLGHRATLQNQNTQLTEKLQANALAVKQLCRQFL